MPRSCAHCIHDHVCRHSPKNVEIPPTQGNFDEVEFKIRHELGYVLAKYCAAFIHRPNPE